MKLASRIIAAFVLIAAVAISWIVVLTSPSDEVLQNRLYEQARAYTDDGIFILAVPILEEAIGFDTDYTPLLEEKLKEIYLRLIDQGNFTRRYLNLLDIQMNREDATEEVFLEAAIFLLDIGRRSTALDVMRDGIGRTGGSEIANLYEENRYRFRLAGRGFDEVMAIHGEVAVAGMLLGGGERLGFIGFREYDLWGFARSNGEVQIPAQFDQISTFSAGRAIVKQNGEIFAIDMAGNRVALLRDERVTDFGNFANNRVTLLVDGEWRRATGAFDIGVASFEDIGMFSGGWVAAKRNGQWGVVDLGDEWLIPPNYDGIIMDSIGRSYGQGAVFVMQGGRVYLYVHGSRVGDAFDDAMPFSEENFAAVKRGGLWGFINTAGEVVIDFQFEEALSFGQHLAAVRVGYYWGFINLFGDIVHEPLFLDAGSFANGSAPVLTERGWQFLTLLD